MSFDFALDPFVNLERHIEYAKSQETEPTAMFLATVDKNGLPSVRAVLFKGLVRGGLSFYTNYNSPKAHDLDKNPKAAVTFFWPKLACQVRVTGRVEKLTRSESESYFKQRPRLSQIGAWASAQSEEISDFAFLEKKVSDLEQRFANQEVPCPPYWGGYHLLPLVFEFWFGKEGRLHQRYVYERKTLDQPWRRLLRSP